MALLLQLVVVSALSNLRFFSSSFIISLYFIIYLLFCYVYILLILLMKPSYQKAAVDAYMTSGIDLPPSFSFDTSFRGYPGITFFYLLLLLRINKYSDISLNGHHYIVYASTSNLDSCPCLSFYSFTKYCSISILTIIRKENM